MARRIPTSLPIPLPLLRAFRVPALALSGALLVGCGSGKRGGDVLLDLLVSVATDLIDVPTDATPSFDASTIYFVTDGDSASGVYEIGAEADADPTQLAEATHARGVVATEEALFIADPGADGVFRLPFAGGALTLVEGTAGYQPVALDGTDGITFAGTDPSTGEVGVFRVSADGGTPSLLGSGFEGALSGVVVAEDGAIYATGDGDGLVYALSGAELTVLAEDVELGSPAGIALSPDKGEVMVSSLDGNGRSQVLLIDPESQETAVFNKEINQNTSSGGLHRALGAPKVFAWADSAGDNQGKVYRIQF